MRLDNIDSQIVRLLARDSRTLYKNIASAVGITPSAAKKRINKMILNGVIRGFAVVINPVVESALNTNDIQTKFGMRKA